MEYFLLQIDWPDMRPIGVLAVTVETWDRNRFELMHAGGAALQQQLMRIDGMVVGDERPLILLS
eukprot:3703025-Pleurochrysis_carterae.AAC.1